MSDGEPERRQIPPVINDGCKRSDVTPIGCVYFSAATSA